MAIVFPNVSLSGVGNSVPLYIYATDIAGTPTFQMGQVPNRDVVSIGLQGTMSAGASLIWSVQITTDPPGNLVNWLNLFNLTNQTASNYAQFIFPVTAWRLACTQWSSGTITLGSVQWP
jgi:hypothetical protein